MQGIIYFNMTFEKGNQYYKLAVNLGRPRKIETFNDFEALVIGYFNEQKDLKKPKYTITGLSCYVGLTKTDFNAQADRGRDFSDLIKKAKEIIENCYENQLYTTGCAGAIFALKNMGWKDSQETNLLNNGKSFAPPKIISE